MVLSLFVNIFIKLKKLAQAYNGIIIIYQFIYTCSIFKTGSFTRIQNNWCLFIIKSLYLYIYSAGQTYLVHFSDIGHAALHKHFPGGFLQGPPSTVVLVHIIQVIHGALIGPETVNLYKRNCWGWKTITNKLNLHLVTVIHVYITSHDCYGLFSQ